MPDDAPKVEIPATSQAPALPTLSRWASTFIRLGVRYNRLMIGVSDWMTAIVGLALVGTLVAEFNKNNLTLGIALIAVMCALSSSAFGLVRATDSKDAQRDKVLFAGERLLHGAVLALLGASLKWIQISADKYPMADSHGIVVGLINWLAGMSSVAMFTFSFFYARIGIRTLSASLFELAGRRPELVD